MDTCIACSMPLHSPDVIGAIVDEGKACIHCSSEDKKSVKSCEEVFEGGALFFLMNIGKDRELAERLSRKTMQSLPYWQKRPCSCLEGETATEEEFQKAMESVG